ncbi:MULTISPECIES: universal stress protein [unclassified Carboxylicivirga]|uniref:universal stress protein n=1 Tax=Carboxylicivirga TaxID=1628153 RepID=UPI003D355264
MKLLDKILVPIQVSEPANNQLTLAMELAKKFGSRLLLLHVLPTEARSQKVKEILSRYVDKDFEKVITEVKEQHLEAEKHIAYGNIFEQIISAAERESANLILIPNNFHIVENHQTIDYLAEKLIRKSEKPVWVVQEATQGTPKTILCPVDYSEASRRALINAIKIARIFQSKLYVVNVFEPLDELYSIRYSVDYEEENKELERENSDSFAAFLETFSFVDVEYECLILRGKPHQKIIDFATEKKVDVLFMGATGKTFFQRLLLGSVTELVIRDLPCSVVVTKSENILNLKMEKDISDIERLLANAKKLEAAGFYDDSIEQLKTCLTVNDLHLPAIYSLVQLYRKTGNEEMAVTYQQKADEIVKRLWDKNVELEIRKGLKLD